MVVSPVDIASVIVGIVAAGSAWLSSRAATKASVTNTNVSSRLDSEKEAYERARSYDMETIQRQAEDLREVREENQELREKVQQLEDWQSRVTQKFPQLLEGLLNERLNEPDPDDKGS